MKRVGEESFRENDRHYPDVTLLIVIHLVISFITCVVVVIRIYNTCFNANREVGMVVSVFHGETHLLLIN